MKRVETPPRPTGGRMHAGWGRMYDIQQQIIAAAGGRQVDPILWEYLFAAFLSMHVGSIEDHIAKVESIAQAGKASQ